MRNLVVILFIMVSMSSFVSAAEPAAAWKLSEADGKKWLARIEKQARTDGWVIELKGNVIIVRRKLEVDMSVATINAPITGKYGDGTTPVGKGTIQYTLRFGPKVSMDDYERMVAVNKESSKEYDRLHRAVGLTHKFDDFIATTAEEKERVRKFREAVAKLTYHELPGMYTPDHSLYFHREPKERIISPFPTDKTIREECAAVEEKLKLGFGKYER
jgi:hypothetical protein